ncbi:MAG: hypothetical protein GY706_01965, partial [Bacteroides sp.]|nr:hypothetical protein [Bacteroides sp.]
MAFNTELTGEANVLMMGDTLSGKIAKETIAEYRLRVEKNSPIEFLIKGFESGAGYSIELVDAQNGVVFEAPYSGGRDSNFVYTPQNSGQTLLRLTGTRNYGDYQIRVRQVTTNKALTGEANALMMGDTLSGKIAKEAIAEYRFQVEKNSPIEFLVKGFKSAPRYDIEMVDPGGSVVYEAHSSDHKDRSFVYTPQRSARMVLRLTGTQEYGDYQIKMRQFTTDAVLSAEANVLAIGDKIFGKIAEKAIAEYRFKAENNSPVEFLVKG